MLYFLQISAKTWHAFFFVRKNFEVGFPFSCVGQWHSLNVDGDKNRNKTRNKTKPSDYNKTKISDKYSISSSKPQASL